MNLENLSLQLQELFILYIPKAVLALLTLIIGFWVVGKITRFTRRRFLDSGMEESLGKFLSSTISVALKIMLILSVINMFGINTTSFVAFMSALLVGIGMALNGTIGHFASGVMIMLFKPFQVGDLVDLGGHVGHVDSINAFNTCLITLSNKKIIIGNSTVTSNVITNISGQGKIGVDMTFGIGYDDDIDLARKVLTKVAESCPFLLKEHPTLIQVSTLADSSVNFLVRPWCESSKYWDVYFYFHENVKKEFDKAGVGIPFPQMDVHMINN